MPECIFCKTEKPVRSFDAEHVLSRGLCGAGNNWTLNEQVCRTCNRRFSAFEAHWMRQAIEATARNFLGPVGRSGSSPRGRAQPVEIDHVYIVNSGDSTVYEAGFAFPNDHHYLPQIVETDRGLLPVAPSEDEGAMLMAALNALDWSALEVTVPIWHQKHEDWLVAELGPRRRVGWTVRSYSRAPRPRGMWLRSFPHASFLSRNRIIDSDHSMSTRIALDHRGRLYIRAANVEAVPRFLTRVASNDIIQATAPCGMQSGGQRVLFGLELDLVKIYLAVLKTGINLFAHLFGADMVRHATFDDVRDLLLVEPTDRTRVLRFCRMYDQDAPDFPRSGNPLEHRLQIDVRAAGAIRFRMRLFDSLGYEAVLGLLPEEWQTIVTSRRVTIAFQGEGMSEVTSWS